MLCALVGWLAETPVQAGVSGQGSSPGGIRSAAVQPAPLVTDSGPARSSKRGLLAPAMSAAMTAANASKQRQDRAFLQLTIRAAIQTGKCARSSCMAGRPMSRNLAATQQPQIRDYFCGPATISEMLAQMDHKVSQLKAARELGTTTAGTDWSDGTGYPMPNVLNRNQGRNDYVAVALPWSPTSAQIKTYEVDLVTDINHNGGVPLAGNAYEVAGGPHLVGNPEDQTIYHWIDIRGYQDLGAVTDYEDSVHDASSIGWDVPAYSSLASTTMADILGARGYDW
jgi:hypothetical protein